MMQKWTNWWRNEFREHNDSECDDLIEIERGSEHLDVGDPRQIVEDSKQDEFMKMETEMNHLCYSLSCAPAVFEKSIEHWLQEFDQYIADYGRLLYSTISTYIYELEEEKYASFEANVFNLFQHVMRQDLPEDAKEKELCEKRRRNVMKFYDHVNLAHRQFVLYSGEQKDLEIRINAIVEPKLANASKELTSQLVGLVAIFTALSFIIFGGISSLENLLSALTQKDTFVLPTLVVITAWAFCFMNLLFVFMYFILRIVGEVPDEDLKTMVQKYPLIMICNYILLSAFMVFAGAWAAWVTGVGRGIYDCVLSYGDLTFIVGVIVVFSIIVFLGRKLSKSMLLNLRDVDVRKNDK